MAHDHQIIFHEGTSIGVLESAFQSRNDKLTRLHLPSFRSSIHRSVAEVKLLAGQRSNSPLSAHILDKEDLVKVCTVLKHLEHFKPFVHEQ